MTKREKAIKLAAWTVSASVTKDGRECRLAEADHRAHRPGPPSPPLAPACDHCMTGRVALVNCDECRREVCAARRTA